MDTPRLHEVHRRTTYFRADRLPRGRGLDMVEVPRAGDGAFAHPWPSGAQLSVTVRVYVRDGHIFVGAPEVENVPQTLVGIAEQLEPPSVVPLDVTTDIWRAIPVGQLRRAALAEVHDPELAHDLSYVEMEAAQALVTAVNDGEHPQIERRGRPTKLTGDALTVVATAYLRGGSTPIKAVQRALDARPDFRGVGRDGQVTRGQAANAVKAARKAGFLPPKGGNT